ncbi:MAG TPA: biotin--[acetyl-CoA-carboxylase] ligase [Usitatibacter sp.]|jgi:BirA family transcriptional regulator, biotin operon repressor / biotin---[acetyl-CoA-carboxylase] ligase|nr:biotin--[acetyl-CoA-carboxylase] ligase [Usitatibacter sp.]
MSALTFLALRALADGRFHSGEAMARSFQRSRATLSEALKRAPEMGIELFSVPGKGYRVAEPIDFLDAAAISSELARHDKRLRLDVVDEIESTSTRVLQLAAAGATSGTCIAAEWQSTGRGRRGRAWISRLGGSLTFSMLWRFERGAGHLGGLSLAVGEAVARALSECGVPRVQVKWPNDVVVDLRKLAGILVETSGEIQGPSVAVIGVGVNHRLSERVLDRIDQPVTDVWQCAGSPPSRSDLLARMLVTLASSLDAFDRSGFSASRDAWRALHAYQGRRVRVTPGRDAPFDAEVVDVAPDGALVVSTADGRTIPLASAEMTLRAK